MARLVVGSLEKSYGSVRAVEDVSFTVDDGSIMTLLGPSGCGKTTTLRCVAGLERPERGEIQVGEKALFSADSKISLPPEKRSIGMVFQSYAIWPHMNVFDNIAYPLKVKRRPMEEVKSRVKEVVILCQLDGLENRPATALSGGQQQRVALARALVAHPDVLLLDEPMSNLDARLRESMRHEIRKLQKELGITTLYVTHDQTEALFLSKKIAIMSRGRVLQIGTPKEVYSRPKNREVALFLGETNLVEGKPQQQGGEIRVDCKIGPIFLKDTGLDKWPDNVTLCIRPENITVSRENSWKSNAFYGKIVSQSYFGDFTEYEFLAEGTEFRLHSSTDLGLQPQDKAWVYLPSDKISVIDSA